MIDEQTVRKLYKKLTIKTNGLGIQELADIFGISKSDVFVAINELASRGLVRKSNDVVEPIAWWDADRIDLFLNVPRMTEKDFAKYCGEIDVLAKEMRAKGLPILRPYSNETVIEILVGIGTFALLMCIVQTIADFVERVTSKGSIPYVKIEGTLRTKHKTDMVISAKGSNWRDTIKAFKSLLEILRQEYKYPFTPIRVLFLAANPDGTNRLHLDREIREITEKIRAADFPDWIELFSRWAVRPDDLLQSLNEHRPQIVHFSGHGSPSEEITLEDDNGNPRTVSTEALLSLFRTLKDNIRVVILNSCYSRSQAKAITTVIDCAIGISKTIDDKAAIIFSASFFRAIGFGRSVQEAFEQGKTAIALSGFVNSNTPELLTREDVDASQIFLVQARLIN